MVLACSLVGSKRNSGSCGIEGLKAGVLSVPPENGTLLIKTCFLQHRLLGHTLRVTSGRTPICTVTIALKG